MVKVAVVAKRNKVLDILRGHFLLAILIDHLHKFPSPFEYYNGKGDLWVSAATGFVFVSGLLLGVVNFPKVKEYGMSYVTKKLLKRGVKLHLVGVFLTVVYTLIGLHAGEWPFLGQGILYTDSREILLNALIFKYSYGWADLLIFYAIVVLLSPLVIYPVYKGHWKPVLFVSFLAWLYAFLTPDLQRYSGSYFPVLSWQFLFTIGIIIGKYRNKISTIYRRYFTQGNSAPLFALIASFLILLILSVLDVRMGYFTGETKDFIDRVFTKLELGPGRILAFFVWFTFLYVLVHKMYKYISKYFGWLYFTFGRNSLLTYAVQSVILFASFYIDIPGGYIKNTIVTIYAILLNWALVGVFLRITKRFPALKV